MSTGASFTVPPLPSVSSAVSVQQARPFADVLMFHTADGGEIEILNGVVTMSAGLETAAYLSLFGGNEQDSGLAGDDRKQWWGNLGETEQDRQYRSRTQNLLRSIPAIPANLLRIEDAANADLAWLLEDVADSIEVTATMPGFNRVSIAATIVVGNQRYAFLFGAPWSGASS